MSDNEIHVAVVIDMQQGFTTGTLGNEACKATIPEVLKLLRRANDEKWDLIALTQDTHSASKEQYEETLEGKGIPGAPGIPYHCGEGSEEHQLVPEIKDFLINENNRTNVTFYKPTFGSISMMENFVRLYERKQSNVVFHFCGVCTGICVLTNVCCIRTALPNARIIVHTKATACLSEETKKTALDAMKLIQVEFDGN